MIMVIKLFLKDTLKVAKSLLPKELEKIKILVVTSTEPIANS